MTIESPDAIDNTEIEDGQAAGSITPLRLRKVVDSLAGLFAPSAKTASFTFDFTQRGCIVPYNSASTGNATVPPNSSVGFDIGTVLGLAWDGPAAPTLVAGSGVTFVAPHGVTPFAAGSIIYAWQRSLNVWWISGDTA